VRAVGGPEAVVVALVVVASAEEVVVDCELVPQPATRRARSAIDAERMRMAGVSQRHLTVRRAPILSG
jgi:hypothetical protein